MHSYCWIFSLIIVVVNLTTGLSAPYGEFYFPDKFEKFKEFYPEKLNRQLIFDHDYHIDDHRRYSHQQQEQMHGQTEDEQDSNTDDQNNNHNFQNDGDNNNNENDNQDSENNDNFDNLNNENNNGGQIDSSSESSGESNNNFDWHNNNNNNNGFPKDFPAVANTVCESRCNNNVTPQYNPICGNDGLTYYNSGRLNCAQICGKGVKFVRMGICSSALINN